MGQDGDELMGLSSAVTGEYSLAGCIRHRGLVPLPA